MNSKSTVHIRQATAEDADGVAALHAASWRIAYRGALSDAYLAGPIGEERQRVWRGRFAEPAANQHVAVAEVDGRLAGFVCTYGGEDAQWGSFIDNLHVEHEFKRMGIGACLMAEAAQWSRDNYPGQGMYLWVLKSNVLAQRFYDSVGGEVVGEDVWQPPDGSALPKLRYAWRTLDALLARHPGS